MKFIETEYFNDQLEELKRKKYRLVSDDYNEFKKQFSVDNSVCIFGTCYKARQVNSSMGIGKRGGLRFIVLANKEMNVAIPLIIYSKKIQQDISREEVEKAMDSVLKQM